MCLSAANELLVHLIPVSQSAANGFLVFLIAVDLPPALHIEALRSAASLRPVVPRAANGCEAVSL